MNPSADTHRNFDSQLRRLLVRTRRRAVGHGLVRLGATGGTLAVVAAWAMGGEARPDAFNGWGLSLSLAACLACLGWQFVLRPWRSLATPAQLAERVEQEASFDNLVVAAEEARRRPDRWPTADPVAAELRRRLDARAAEVIGLIGPADVLPLRYVRTAQFGFAATVLVTTALLAVVPGEMTRGFGRLLWPTPPPVVVATGGIYPAPGPDHVVVGETMTVAGLDFAGGAGLAVAEVRVGAGLWQAVRAREVPGPATEPGVPAPYRRWEAQVADVREDFTWRFRRGALVSSEREVTVRHYPLLAELSAVVVPPAYTGLPARDLSRLPSWIEVPAGSRLELSGRVSHALSQAALVTDGTDTVALAVDSLVVRGALTIDSDHKFVVRLVDDWGLANQSPLTYEVAAAADQVPGVSLERPDDDGVLPLSGNVTLITECADDFGLAHLRLLARTGAGVPTAASSPGQATDRWLGGEFWSATAAPPAPDAWLELETAAGPLRVRPVRLDAGGTAVRARFRLELRTDGLDLVAGDALELLVEAEDNKQPLPAGRARSAVVRLQLPSAAEVLVTQAEANEDRKSELEEMRRRSRALNADLDRLNRELLKNPVPDWARQQEMEAAIDRQQKLQQELARVAEQLQQELQKLAESQLTSEEQLQKADEMSELLNQGQSQQLADLMQKAQEGGGQASPEDMARAMDEVARNQQDMARRLDAALAMLKRMAQEQELEGLTALLEQMMQKQQELADLSRQLAAQQAAEEAKAAEQAGEDPAADQLAEAEGAEQQGDQQDQQDQQDQLDGEQSGEKSGEQDGKQGDEQGDKQSGDQGEKQDPADSGESSESQSGEQQSGEQKPPTPSAEELARRQEALEKELEQLQEKLEEVLENLRKENAENPRESNEQMADALEKALEQVEKQRQQDQMGKAGDQLEKMDPGEAAKMQEQALRDLGSLYSVLLKSQQAMQAAMEMEQVSSLRGLAADMLALSARQEDISQQIPPQLRDLRSLDLTRGQHRLQKAAVGVRDGLGELMAEAPNRIMKLLKQLDGLIEAMGEGVQAMEDNRAPLARQYARDSLSQANRIVIGMLTEAQMQSSGGGGGGNPQQSMAEKLQQMAQEQAGLNGATDELRRMLADRGISQDARSRMERLGEQQAQMATRLGEMAEEQRLQPEGERLLGDLAELGREMESIGREVEEGLVSDETLVRQERILGRMLDARNSVRRRDFTNRRESRAADDLYADQIGRPGGGGAPEDNPFRLKYQPLEQAPMEYRDLVRRYFAALDSLGRDEAPPPAATEGDVP